MKYRYRYLREGQYHILLPEKGHRAIGLISRYGDALWHARLYNRPLGAAPGHGLTRDAAVHHAIKLRDLAQETTP